MTGPQVCHTVMNCGSTKTTWLSTVCFTKVFQTKGSLHCCLSTSSNALDIQTESGGSGLFLILCLCCFFYVILFSCSSMRSPQDTILQTLQCGSFPWAAVLKELLQHRSFTCGAVLQAQTASAWTRHTSHQKNLLQRGLFSLGHNSCEEPVPAWALHGLQGTSTCSSVRPSMGCRVDICSNVVLHGLQGKNLLHHGLLHKMQGNLLQLLLRWLWCLIAFFNHIFSLLALTAVAQRFFPFLNMFSPRCNQHHSLAQL